jgi:hypothetical protein
MNSNLKCGAIAILALAIGFFVGRGSKAHDGSAPEIKSDQVSVFEHEALSFLNWFRIEGRSGISHEELVRNLRILESKAIASGKLLVFKDQKPSP